MNKLKSLCGAVALLAVSVSSYAEPQSVASLNITKYMGKWHEIARLPMKFQDKCVRDVSATYTLNADKTVTVLNACRKADGSMMSATGLAQAVNNKGSELNVTFLPQGLRWLPVGKADYWVLRIDANYQTALVGTPDKKYAWILSRTAKINEATYQSYVQTAKAQGYDVSKLIRNP